MKYIKCARIAHNTFNQSFGRCMRIQEKTMYFFIEMVITTNFSWFLDSDKKKQIFHK